MAAPEVVFVRPNRKNEHFESNVKVRSKKIVEHLTETLGEKPLTNDELCKFADVFEQDPQAVLAVFHWLELFDKARRGVPIESSSIKAACFIAGSFLDLAIQLPLNQSNPHTRFVAMMLQFADSVALSSSSDQITNACSIFTDYVRLAWEVSMGHCVYRDKFLIVGWRNGFSEKENELYVVVRNSIMNVYTFIPNLFVAETNITPPASSFRNARRAVKAWRGQRLSGELVGSSAIRLCEVLGIEVHGTIGVIPGNTRKSRGF
jgi:hypothetical protein